MPPRPNDDGGSLYLRGSVDYLPMMVMIRPSIAPGDACREPRTAFEDSPSTAESETWR
jgi:hypothetical protein